MDYYHKYLKYKKKYNYLKGKSKKVIFSEIIPVKMVDTNPIIDFNNYQVYKNNNILELIRNNARFTKFHLDCNCPDTYKNFYSYAIMFFEELNKIFPKEYLKIKTLILGFGLGGIPLRLSRLNYVEKIDCVDYDYDLFRIFKTVIPTPSAKINLYHADAINYIKNTNNKYDVIVDDLFEENTKVFYDYHLIYNILNPNGLFFINVHYQPQMEQSIAILEKIFKKVFYRRKDEYLIICYK